MAAKPKLTIEQKSNARFVWESDPRKGFAWLIEELGLDIGQEGMRLIAKADGWVKGGKPSLEKPKSKLGKSKKPSLETKTNIKLPKESKPAKKENDQPEWEEVDEDKIHGNSHYMPAYDRQVLLLCRLGATDAEVAEFFKVTEQTINNWKKWYTNFFESMQAGKILSDAEMANSLYKRGVGYRYEEVKTKVVPVMIDGPDGELIDTGEFKVVEVTTTTKEMPPDTQAAFIWLRNRRPKDWRDKQEVEISSKIDQALLQQLEHDTSVRLEKSRERQRMVLIERGIITEEEDI